MTPDECETLAAAGEIDAAQEAEAAELAEAKARVEAGVVTIGALVVEALNVHRINPVSLELAELRARLEVLSDAAFGDGSIDQHGYELAVQAKFAETLRIRMGQADQINEQRAAQQRRAALLDGVTMRVPPPDGARP